jgi:molybdopterin/thiamine biosynthesis adenylyltransferase
MTDRYQRQIALFGEAGQARVRAAHVVQTGAGGLGMHVIQQLSYLGVRQWTIADGDAVSVSNLNRLVGALPDDVGKPKVDIAARLIRNVQSDADIRALPVMLPDESITSAIQTATVVIGAFDAELPRLRAIETCSLNGVPYVDVATEVISIGATEVVFGGRVVVASDGQGCPDCLGLIDHHELAREQMPPELQRTHDQQYGISRHDLDGSGPSVISMNGVVASLAVTEVMCLLTGLRPPHRQLTYRGDLGVVYRNGAPGRNECPSCTRWRTTYLAS